MKLAILASGKGSNAAAIIEKSKQNILAAEVCIVISNKEDAEVLQLANRNGITSKFINPEDYADRKAYDCAMLSEINKSGADCIALAGYMLLLTKNFLDAFNGPILNVHPSLLPAFAGTKGVANARAYGAKIAGVSVHFVTEIMDNGPLIIQAAMPLDQSIEPQDFMQQIHALEHRIYPQALQWVAENRIHLCGRVTTLKPADRELAQLAPGCLIWPPLEKGF